MTVSRGCLERMRGGTGHGLAPAPHRALRASQKRLDFRARASVLAGTSVWGVAVFKPDQSTEIIQRVADEVVATTSGIQGFAEAACAFARTGNRIEAVEVLLDIELKLNELRALVELASFVNRKTACD